jgi:Arc/MetJ family transcription regulator
VSLEPGARLGRYEILTPNRQDVSARLPSGGCRKKLARRRCIVIHTWRSMMRTNIVLDEKLVRKAFRHSRAKSKRALVHEALEVLIRVRGRRSLLDLKGKVQFAGDYDYKKLRRAK